MKLFEIFPIAETPLFQLLEPTIANFASLLIALGADIFLVVLFWYLRKTKRRERKEAADYMMWYVLGGIPLTVLTFFLPSFVSVYLFFLFPIPWLLVLWRMYTLDKGLDFIEILGEFAMFIVVSLLTALVMSLLVWLPQLLLEDVSALIGVLFSVFLEIVTAYVTYYVLAHYALPWYHNYRGVVQTRFRYERV